MITATKHVSGMPILAAADLVDQDELWNWSMVQNFINSKPVFSRLHTRIVYHTDKLFLEEYINGTPVYHPICYVDKKPEFLEEV